MRDRRPGMVLLLVLVVVALLALAAGTFLHLMVAERKAVMVSGRQGQARASADSGVEMIRLFIVQEKDFQDQLGGWYDNELQFRGRSVLGNQQGLNAARFTVVAPLQEYGLEVGIRYGLEDDSTRLNINVLAALDRKAAGTGRQILMGLPGMTEDIADSILDWLDEDEETREFGAESDYYATLGYAAKNGPLETIEELLLVRGVRENPWLLFGCDVDRNALMDSGELANQNIENVDNSDGSMNRGWAAYLTLYALEANLNPDGEKKIDLNQSDMEQLYEQLEEVLGEQWATFIVAYRLGEPVDAGESRPNTSLTSNIDLDLSQEPQERLDSVLDLIGKNVRLPSGDDQGNEGEGGGAPGAPTPERILESPFPNVPGMMDTYLPDLMDHVAVISTSPLAGRINVNQASRVVLLGIPGMTEEIADRIIGEREPDPTLAPLTHRHETWILSEGIVTLEEMRTLMPFVCAGGCVYRAQVIGYFDQGGPTVRIEIVLDASKDPARIVFWRDISNLGRGYSLETLGLGGDIATTY